MLQIGASIVVSALMPAAADAEPGFPWNGL